MTAVVIRGTPYPVVLPKLRDPRLHLAATITSLQAIGQIGFHFRVSIAQILISLLTCALLEVAITMRKQHVLMWPASALLTGNGVAFVLRVPGTRHGDWWSTRGWWIFAATAAVSLLSKHVIQVRRSHVFNPSNIGLVLCFLVLSSSQAEPLDFWWGPTSWWLVLALAVIVTGGFSILSRLRLLRVALSFWVAFAAGLAVLAAAGHEITARWHLGPISGFHFWWVLVTSPEVLVFLFFMITDPKTAPPTPRARVVYAVAIGLLAALLAAPMHTEYWTKVALLGALAIVCVAQTVLREVSIAVPSRRVLLAAGAATAAAYAAVLVTASPSPTAVAAPQAPTSRLPRITIAPSPGIQSKLSLANARVIVQALITQTAATGDAARIWLEPGKDQSPPNAVVQLAGRTYKLHQQDSQWVVGTKPETAVAVAPTGPPVRGFRLANVASAVGVDFTQDSFRFGVTGDATAMMGGGVCWLDYNNDGWLDLFAVNSYTDAQYAQWQEHGGAPTGALYRNERGRFIDVTKPSGLDLPLRGNGCVAADLDGDGRTDLVVTTAVDDVLFWNDGDGTFSEGARRAGVVSYGWHAGAAVADVNGDGRPDLFIAGYTDYAHPIAGSVKGFPSNYPGVRDELFLNEGHRRFRDVAVRVGLDPRPYAHGLGAQFLDVNGDGRPDLYVANDEDRNQLYLNEPGGPLGFHFVEVGRTYGVADPNAGMGIAAADMNGDGRADLYVTNSRGQGNAAYVTDHGVFLDLRKAFNAGTNPTGWGDSWIDLRNNAQLDLVVANGGIPVTNVRKNAARLQVLVTSREPVVDANLLPNLRVNGRGLAAADFDNDGRVDVAVNTVGGKLLLLRNTSPAGNWLEVDVRPFSPGAVVTVVDSTGRRQLRTVAAGSSYLSSEDPRVHFGFGRATVRSVTVRYPDGTVKRLDGAKTNSIVTVN